jgi:hypothetical protein
MSIELQYEVVKYWIWYSVLRGPGGRNHVTQHLPRHQKPVARPGTYLPETLFRAYLNFSLHLPQYSLYVHTMGIHHGHR